LYFHYKNKKALRANAGPTPVRALAAELRQVLHPSLNYLLAVLLSTPGRNQERRYAGEIIDLVLRYGEIEPKPIDEQEK
jgi:hypothetical protein